MYFAVDRCPTLKVPKNSLLSTTETSYNTVVSCMCQKGYQFPDKSKIRTITCLYGKVWSNQFGDCQSKLSFCQYFVRISVPAMVESIPTVDSMTICKGKFILFF